MWTLFCKSCNQTWKRFCFLDLRVFEENRAPSCWMNLYSDNDNSHGKWRFADQFLLLQGCFAHVSWTEKSQLVTAGSVQGLTTLAPGVLSQAHACACACADCDTLAQRLNQKLQLGQNHYLFFFCNTHRYISWRQSSSEDSPYVDSLIATLQNCRERSSDASRLLLVQSSQLWDAFEPRSVDALVMDHYLPA